MTYKRKEVIGDCTLYLGDCMEVMPMLGKVDAVVTDPPYGIEDIVGGYGRAGRTIKNDKDTKLYSEMACAAYNITDVMLSFYSARNTPEIMGAIPNRWYSGEIIWDKKAPGMGRGIRYQHENIAVSLKNGAKLVGDSFSVISVYRAGNIHPHEKPVNLMSSLLELVGATILDPFMGSGSTGVACVNLGRKFIGIELDEDYFEIACRRIQEAYNQPRLALDEPAKPVQQSIEF